jgi:hypothetical protein
MPFNSVAYTSHALACDISTSPCTAILYNDDIWPVSTFALDRFISSCSASSLSDLLLSMTAYFHCMARTCGKRVAILLSLKQLETCLRRAH